MTQGDHFRKLVRVLKRGGVLVRQDGQWVLRRMPDARFRAIGMLADDYVTERLEKGDLEPLNGDPGRLIWTAATEPRASQRSDDGPAVCHRSTRRRRRRRSLLEQVAANCQSEAEGRRLLRAAARYLADVESAATPQSMTMRWDLASVSNGRRRRGSEGPGVRAVQAAASLRKLRQVVDDDTYFIVTLVVVHGISRAGLMTKLSLSQRAALKRAGEALTSLADAYDRALPSAV